MMRRFLFLITGIILSLVISQAQDPEITPGSDALEFDIAAGDTSVKYLVIQNTGNRDLEWFAGNFWCFVEFEKEDSADYTLAENQDSISENVRITRGDSEGIFNIAVESSFDGNSPLGTLWAMGATDEVSPADYTTWGQAVGWNPPAMVGQMMSLHIPEEGSYYDILFTHWSIGGAGGAGGFSYFRMEPIFWIEVRNGSGVTEPLDSDSMIVMVDPTGMVAGTYTGQVLIQSNDPDMPELAIPVTMILDGIPDIDVETDSIGFDTAYVGGTYTREIEISNPGTDVLELSLSSDETAFEVPSSLTIPAQESRMLEIGFHPSAVQAYEGVITLTAARPDTTVEIKVTGEGVVSSQMEVAPVSFVFDTVPGYFLTDSFLVKNTGQNTLIFSIEGYPETFEKADYADWTLPENQDRLSENVWFTRADEKGLFNIRQEENFIQGISPVGTEWAEGEYYFAEPGDYGSYDDVIRTPRWNIGDVFALHLIEDDEYYNVVFTSWTSGGNGGGFSYVRTKLPSFLNVSLPGDTLAPGDSAYVSFTADARDATAGEWPLAFDVLGNDPSNPSVTIDITAIITGEAQILAPGSMGFGDVFIGDTATGYLNFNNTGTDTLRINDIVSTSSELYWTDVTSIVIPPDDEEEIMVYFTPDAEGVIRDTLHIFSNDAYDPEIEVIMGGTGVLPPELSLDPTSITSSFTAGSVDTVDVVIENTGAAALIWKATAYDDKVVFVKEDWADYSLAGNQDRITDQVWITRADEEGLFNIVTETGFNGDSPDGTFWAPGRTSQVDLADYDTWVSSLDWWPAYNALGNWFSMIIPGDAEVYDIFYTGWTSGDGEGNSGGGGFSWERYHIAKWIGAGKVADTIPPGEKDTVEVFLNATNLVKGEYAADLYFMTNDPLNKEVILPISISLSGVPKITFEQDTLAFDTTYVGGESTGFFPISNDSTDVLEITIEPGTTGMFVPETESLSIQAGEGHDLAIAFSPAESVNYKDTLVLNTNDPSNPSIRVPLEGNGKASPSMSISSLVIEDSLFADSVSTHIVTIENTGAGDLYLDFGIAPAWLGISVDRDTLSTDESVDVEFTLDAAGLAGEYQTQVYLANNDPLMQETAIEVNLVVSGMFVVNPVADLLLNEGFGMHKLFAGDVFENAHQDSIGITPISSETGVVTVIVEEDTLLITETGTGTSLITLMGKDAHGNRAFDDFTLTMNTKPVVAGPLADVLVNEGFGTQDIDLSTVFSDPEDEMLTLSAVSSETGVVTASVTASTLTVTEAGTGSANFVVTAEDPHGLVASDTFSFVVNALPVVDQAVADVSVDEGFGTHTIDVSAVFSDADSDDLTMTVESADETVVTAAIDGNVITLTEQGVGETTVTLTAEDDNGGSASDEFTVTVNHISGIDASDYESINLYPNPSAGDVHIRFEHAVEGVVYVRVLDITGKLVYDNRHEVVAGNIEMDLTDLADGQYFIRVMQDKRIIAIEDLVIVK